MKGCLSLPFRLLSLALLLLAGYLAWTYRDAIRRQLHEWTADRGRPEATGRGDASLVPGAEARIAALGTSGRDTVVLSAAEVASLIAAAAATRLPGALDSIEVQLKDDQVEVHGRVDTHRVPFSFGPLSGVIHDKEAVDAGGRFVFRRRGLAEWQVTRARVRGIPLPREVLGRLLGGFSGGADGVLPVPLPVSVGGLRVSPGGVVLYGTGPGRPAL